MGIFGKENKLFKMGLALYEQGEEKYSQALDPLKEAAKLGHRDAQYLCGVIYESQGDSYTGNRWYAEAAKQFHPQAQEKIREVIKSPACRDAYGLDDYVRKLAKKGDPDGQCVYSAMLLEKAGKEKWETEEATKFYRRAQEEEALKWAIKAAKQGHQDAQVLCGETYQRWGEEETAFHWFLQAARKDHPTACEKCGRLLFDQKKYQEAAGWLLRAWDLGELSAILLCVDAYGKTNTEESRARALELCERIIGDKALRQDKFHETDYQIAMYKAGDICYGAGEKRKALEWYEKAADSYYFAALKCGEMYYEGDGVERDYKKALKHFCYCAQARHGNKDALYQCGKMYFFGEGTEPDKITAFEYFSRLAERADYRGISMCAVMYYYGIGVEENQEKAKELTEGISDTNFNKQQREWERECKERGVLWRMLKLQKRTVCL